MGRLSEDVGEQSMEICHGDSDAAFANIPTVTGRWKFAAAKSRARHSRWKTAPSMSIPEADKRSVEIG